MRMTSRMISGPMPSPGRTRILRLRGVWAIWDRLRNLRGASLRKVPVAGLVPAIHVLGRCRVRQRRGWPGQARPRGYESGPGLGHAEDPGPLQPRLLFIGGDPTALLLGQADIVEPVEEAMLA